MENSLRLFLLITYIFFLSPLSLLQTNANELFGENSRWSIDASTRANRNTDKNQNESVYVIGLDIHKVFSNNTLDIGTLTFQPYIVKLNNVNNPSFIFDDGNDTQLTWRIANFNYTAINQGKFNIRAGHFEIPYGLEYYIDSNGTLRQFTASTRGIKTDWGISVNGILSNLEYEIALTQGSGNELMSRHNPHIFSGRLGTLSHKNMITGLSWFTGDVLGENGVTKQKKLGIDTSYYYYQWQFIMESSVGSIEDNNTKNIFIEGLWNNPRETFSIYLQIGYQKTDRSINNGEDSTSYWITGAQWLSKNDFDFSAQYKHKLNDEPTIEIDPLLSIQLRYRFQG